MLQVHVDQKHKVNSEDDDDFIGIRIELGCIDPPAGYRKAGGASLGEDGEVKGFDFNDQSIRRAFIRKVYSILMCQLLVTMGFIALFIFHERTRLWVRANPYMFWIAFVIVFVTMIAMACCESVRRQSPLYFIFLTIFTLAGSFLVGVASSVYEAREVLMAVGITAAVCLALTFFAFQIKWDFTIMRGFLLCATVVLVLFGLIAIFLPSNRIVTLVYACYGALLFSMHLVYDTQLMMGGKHKYIFKYMDIVTIFLSILTIIGAVRD